MFNHVLTKIHQITTPFQQSCNTTNRRVRDKFCNRSIIILFTCKFFKSQCNIIELLKLEFEFKMSNKKCIIPSYYLSILFILHSVYEVVQARIILSFLKGLKNKPFSGDVMISSNVFYITHLRIKTLLSYCLQGKFICIDYDLIPNR